MHKNHGKKIAITRVKSVLAIAIKERRLNPCARSIDTTAMTHDPTSVTRNGELPDKIAGTININKTKILNANRDRHRAFPPPKIDCQYQNATTAKISTASGTCQRCSIPPVHRYCSFHEHDLLPFFKADFHSPKPDRHVLQPRFFHVLSRSKSEPLPPEISVSLRRHLPHPL